MSEREREREERERVIVILIDELQACYSAQLKGTNKVVISWKE